MAIIVNLTDNRTSMSWVGGNRILSGASIRLQFSFLRELIRRKNVVRVMRLGSEHNTTIDFLTSATDEDIEMGRPKCGEKTISVGNIAIFHPNKSGRLGVFNSRSSAYAFSLSPQPARCGMWSGNIYPAWRLRGIGN